MLKSYLKIAWRNITRHKLYSLINILGLALGICSCIVIYLVAQFELSTDDFHPDAARIYRIIDERQENNGDVYRDANIPPGTAQTVREKMPGVETSAAYHFYQATITIPDSADPKKKFDNKLEGRSTPSTIIAEPQYFAIFKYDWLAGNATAVREPNTVVLSETKARKYFGATPLQELIGKEMVYNDSLRVRVAGIVKDWKGTTDFPFSEFISFSTIENGFLPKDIFSEVSDDGHGI